MKVMLSPLSTSNCNLECMVSAQQEEDTEEMAGGAGADLLPPLSTIKGAISSARIVISDNACSLQSTTAFGEHQRHSRATGIRLAHTTVKELLGLQAFALSVLI